MDGPSGELHDDQNEMWQHSDSWQKNHSHSNEDNNIGSWNQEEGVHQQDDDKQDASLQDASLQDTPLQDTPLQDDQTRVMAALAQKLFVKKYEPGSKWAEIKKYRQEITEMRQFRHRAEETLKDTIEQLLGLKTENETLEEEREMLENTLHELKEWLPYYKMENEILTGEIFQRVKETIISSPHILDEHLRGPTEKAAEFKEKAKEMLRCHLEVSKSETEFVELCRKTYQRYKQFILRAAGDAKRTKREVSVMLKKLNACELLQEEQNKRCRAAEAENRRLHGRQRGLVEDVDYLQKEVLENEESLSEELADELLSEGTPIFEEALPEGGGEEDKPEEEQESAAPKEPPSPEYKEPTPDEEYEASTTNSNESVLDEETPGSEEAKEELHEMPKFTSWQKSKIAVAFGLKKKTKLAAKWDILREQWEAERERNKEMQLEKARKEKECKQRAIEERYNIMLEQKRQREKVLQEQEEQCAELRQVLTKKIREHDATLLPMPEDIIAIGEILLLVIEMEDSLQRLMIENKVSVVELKETAEKRLKLYKETISCIRNMVKKCKQEVVHYQEKLNDAMSVLEDTILRNRALEEENKQLKSLMKSSGMVFPDEQALPSHQKMKPQVVQKSEPEMELIEPKLKQSVEPEHEEGESDDLQVKEAILIQDEPEPVPLPVPEQEPEPESEPEPVPKTEPKLDAVPEPEPELGAVPEPEPKLDAVPEPEPKLDAVPEPEPKLDAMPDPEPRLDAVPEPEPRLHAVPDPVPRLDAVPEPEPRLDAMPEPEPRLDAMPEPEPRLDAMPEPKPDAMPEPEPDAMPEPEPRLDAVSEPAPHLDVVPELVPKPEPAPQTEQYTESKPEPESFPVFEFEPEIGTVFTSEHEPKPPSESQPKYEPEIVNLAEHTLDGERLAEPEPDEKLLVDPKERKSDFEPEPEPGSEKETVYLLEHEGVSLHEPLTKTSFDAEMDDQQDPKISVEPEFEHKVEKTESGFQPQLETEEEKVVQREPEPEKGIVLDICTDMKLSHEPEIQPSVEVLTEHKEEKPGGLETKVLVKAEPEEEPDGLQTQVLVKAELEEENEATGTTKPQLKLEIEKLPGNKCDVSTLPIIEPENGPETECITEPEIMAVESTSAVPGLESETGILPENEHDVMPESTNATKERKLSEPEIHVGPSTFLDTIPEQETFAEPELTKEEEKALIEVELRPDTKTLDKLKYMPEGETLMESEPEPDTDVLAEFEPNYETRTMEEFTPKMGTLLEFDLEPELGTSAESEPEVGALVGPDMEFQPPSTRLKKKKRKKKKKKKFKTQLQSLQELVKRCTLEKSIQPMKYPPLRY
ncbi:titin-like [Erpetoichthys calabaricus]|uniref:titin-like n=1 Tax=Erpetoichthys calabaricus TaxID=27687 RepID=UPI0022345EFD|nr:titin-like [Erpetoichthys calabaricus]